MAQVENFFNEQTEASKLKTEIVSKYFSSWANVIATQPIDKIVYLDLFSGPGRYDDGNPSTPLFVIENSINHSNKKVPQKVELIFNDGESQFIQALKDEIKKIPDISKLRFNPSTYNEKIDDKIIKNYENITQVPTLSFIDPCGYKGLSLPLIRALVKGWGCDCIFFFNYRRINAGIDNPSLKKPINLVFTKDILDELRQSVSGKSPNERETIVLDKLKEVFKGWGMEYVLPFPFKNETGARTSHYLIFVTKNILGYNIMKDIMGRCSSSHIQEVPSFEYNPAANFDDPQLPLFKREPIEKLKKMLIDDFEEITLTMKEVYEHHHIDKPYVKKNYKKALLHLEEENKIKTNRNERKTRKGTFPDHMLVMFPKK
ncbi:three-Cys-motif partner protein TcmP [Thermodesulfobacteriota bacterium]